MKPHYGLFLPWALLRGGMALPGRVRGHGRGRARRCRCWCSGSPTTSTTCAWCRSSASAARPTIPNHSINGLLNRIMGIADPEQYKNLEFVAGQFPPFNPWVYGLTLSSSARDPCCRAPASQHDRRSRPPVRLLPHGAELHDGLAHRLGAPLRHPAADLRRAGRSGRAETSAAGPAGRRLRARQRLHPGHHAAGARRRSTSRNPICCLPR